MTPQGSPARKGDQGKSMAMQTFEGLDMVSFPETGSGRPTVRVDRNQRVPSESSASGGVALDHRDDDNWVTRSGAQSIGAKARQRQSGAILLSNTEAANQAANRS